MRDLKHILLPTDFSENARIALPGAAALSRRYGAVLHMLHVVTPLPWPAHRVLEKQSIPTLNDEIRRRCRRRLQEFAELVGDEVTSEIHVAEGQPADEIVSFAASHEIGLIAMSTKGHSGLKRFMLGSTTEKVARTAPCSLLAVRPSPASWDKLRKIVVPTDFSKLSRLAIREAAEFARPHGAEILLVHVLEETEYPIGRVLKGHGVLDFKEQARRGVQTHLEELASEMLGDPTSARIVVREGVPSATIVDLAEEEGADAIVLATHGREGLLRFVLGSTAERVVRVAPCSVLVVKQRNE